MKTILPLLLKLNNITYFHNGLFYDFSINHRYDGTNNKFYPQFVILKKQITINKQFGDNKLIDKHCFLHKTDFINYIQGELKYYENSNNIN